MNKVVGKSEALEFLQTHSPGMISIHEPDENEQEILCELGRNFGATAWITLDRTKSSKEDIVYTCLQCFFKYSQDFFPTGVSQLECRKCKATIFRDNKEYIYTILLLKNMVNYSFEQGLMLPK